MLADWTFSCAQLCHLASANTDSMPLSAVCCLQNMMKALQCFFIEFWDLTVHEQPWMNTTRSKMDPSAAPEAPMSNAGWCVNMPSNTRLCHIRSQTTDDLTVNSLPKFHLVGAFSLATSKALHV